MLDPDRLIKFRLSSQGSLEINPELILGWKTEKGHTTLLLEGVEDLQVQENPDEIKAKLRPLVN